MTNPLSRGELFDKTLVTDLINKVKGHSSITKLSTQKPVPFNGSTQFTFNFDSDIDIVAENGSKSHGGGTLEPITIMPIKVEYGMRVSDEFLYATEEEKIEILKGFNDGFSTKVARGLDLMAFHGINPRTKTASAIIGNNCFDKAVTQTVTFTDADPDGNIEVAVGMVQGAENVVNGMAMDPIMSTSLSKLKVNGVKQFSELSWGANPGAVNGLPTDVNTTVSYGMTDPKDVAIIGDFQNMFRWGFAKEIPMEVIKYGDPDNSGNDLKGKNQVYIRSEAYLGWAIMDPSAFARIIKTGA